MTDMRSAMRKYNTAREAVDRWEGELSSNARNIWLRYHNLATVLEPNQRRYDQMPDEVTSVSEYNGSVTISGTWTRRGCTDHESCSIPSDLFFASPDEQDRMLTEMQIKIDAMNARKAAAALAKQEEYEREQLAILKEKYGL